MTDEHEIESRSNASIREVWVPSNGELEAHDSYIEAIVRRREVECSCGEDFDDLESAEEHLRSVGVM